MVRWSLRATRTIPQPESLEECQCQGLARPRGDNETSSQSRVGPPQCFETILIASFAILGRRSETKTLGSRLMETRRGRNPCSARDTWDCVTNLEQRPWLSRIGRIWVNSRAPESLLLFFFFLFFSFPLDRFSSRLSILDGSLNYFIRCPVTTMVNVTWKLFDELANLGDEKEEGRRISRRRLHAWWKFLVVGERGIALTIRQRSGEASEF